MSNQPHIDGYTFGRITIDGQTYTNDVIIFPDHVKDSWWRDEGHSLSIPDLADVLEAQPDLLVIGQGNSGRMSVPERVINELEEHGIQVQAEHTGSACETYNELRAQKNVVAALHLTC